MPQTADFPFRRVDVDHLVAGRTRVWWQLDYDFNDPFPHEFSLEFGFGGTTAAADWTTIGLPQTNTYFAIDPDRRTYGKLLTVHYRIRLVTPIRTYVSNPVDCLGELDERGWALAREILRKETLRHGYVSNDGILLKMRRNGRASTAGVDLLTGGITDSSHPAHLGTGIDGGYYPPLQAQCWDFTQTGLSEENRVAGSPGTHQPTQAKIRALGYPQLLTDDVWVDAKTDERWRISRVTVQAAIRRVPLIYDVELSLLPFSHPVYRFPIGGDLPDGEREPLPTAGSGCVAVDHDYGGVDVLAYAGVSCGVVGADILAFRREDWDAGLRSTAYVIAASTTGADGRWQFALMLDPGEYVLRFEKPGEYGPDEIAVTVVRPPAPGESASGFTFGPI